MRSANKPQNILFDWDSFLAENKIFEIDIAKIYGNKNGSSVYHDVNTNRISRDRKLILEKHFNKSLDKYIIKNYKKFLFSKI